ncbi:MAG TPA: MotA/TolQ/ExbB proton channel family protein [Zeimonas sp.]|nr:MotA/TolQ/ExbB proton channel family protein [Zeimonas sp.]
MPAFESLLYEISRFFLAPVLVLLAAMFAYALYCLGALLAESALRGVRGHGRRPLARWLHERPGASVESLELHVLRRLEMQRIVSRTAPMLGLVATMIPMGPALVAVASGDAQEMAENLVVAFSAVIVALLSAAITFVVQSVRRRWLLEELDALLGARGAGDA